MSAKPKFLYLYLVVLTNIIPHFFSLPYWAVATALGFLVWKMLGEVRQIPTPNRWLNLLLAGACALLVYRHFGTFLGSEAGTTLLLLMTCLKLFELRSYRDAMFISYLCYFLLMSKLLDSQGIGTSLFMVFDVVLITGLLVSHHYSHQELEIRQIIRRTGRLVAQSLPLTLIVFFLFPRFSTGLLSRPGQAVGRMGFSDQVKPGSISQLIRSDEVAFRARVIKGDRPSLSSLYWRGVVLEESRGLEWRLSPSQTSIPRREAVEAGYSVAEIFMEPSSHRWLMTLDWTDAVVFSGTEDSRVIQHPGRIFSLQRPLISRGLYRVHFQPLVSQVLWGPVREVGATQVDENDSPKAKELALAWKKRGLSEVEVAAEIMGLFSREGFSYSLNPGSVANIDDFLFRSKKGFCEHYAATAASLLRWAGIPARVVAGFQGGSPSLLDDYLTVRYVDAHSWVEYFVKSRNAWLRLDPTSILAPERLALGGQRYLDQVEGQNRDLFAGNQALNQWFGAGLVQFYFRSRMIFDQLEASWINFLLKYDYSFQRQLLQSFGLGSISRPILIIILVLVVALFLTLYSWRLRRIWGRRDPAVEAYRSFCERLALYGLSKRPEEGPLHFAERAMESFPGSRDLILRFMDDYLSSRYGGKPLSEATMKWWRQEIHRHRFTHPAA